MADTNTPQWASPGEGYRPGRIAPCKGKDCNQLVCWWRTPAGKHAPYDRDGTSHFATCPNADDFRNDQPEEPPVRAAVARPSNAVAELRTGDKLDGWLTTGDGKVLYLDLPQHLATDTFTIEDADTVAELSKYAGQRMVVMPFVPARADPEAPTDE